jgi:D-alanine-D-alanine ligase-like ATP-grasp enzyme
MADLFRAAIARQDPRLSRDGEWWVLEVNGVAYVWKGD